MRIVGGICIADMAEGYFCFSIIRQKFRAKILLVRLKEYQYDNVASGLFGRRIELRKRTGRKILSGSATKYKKRCLVRILPNSVDASRDWVT